jgi:hypothetical protein
LVVLFHSVLQDVISVGSPSVTDVELDTSTWEEDTIEFWQEVSNVRLVAVSQNGNNLCAGHFNELDVRGSNVSLEASIGLQPGLIVFVRLSVDTDDGSLVW